MLNWISSHSPPIKGVINIGSSFGRMYYRFKKINITNMIFIEPIPHVLEYSINQIEKAQSDNENILFFNVAMSDYDGKAEFFLSNNNESSSLLPFKKHLEYYRKVRTEKTIDVTVNRLDTLFETEKLDIKNYNFIFMDTNGNDYQALVGAGDILNSINFIVSEVFQVELYSENKLISEEDRYLEKLGFERVKTDWTIKKEQEIWGNALYYRA